MANQRRKLAADPNWNSEHGGGTIIIVTGHVIRIVAIEEEIKIIVEVEITTVTTTTVATQLLDVG